jgi:hypothetical protein
MPRLSLVLILKKVEKWEAAYLRLRAIREQMRDPVVGPDDTFLAAFHGESAARENLLLHLRSLKLAELHLDPGMTVTLDNLFRLTWSNLCDWNLRILREIKAALLIAVKPVHRPGRPRDYPLEPKEYAQKLAAENPRMTAKELRARTKTKFRRAKLPPDDKTFREWIRPRKQKGR